MKMVVVQVFGLEGLRPEEYERSQNPEGIYKSFNIDSSRDVDLQVCNRIREHGNDPVNFEKFTANIWLRKDLDIVPIDDTQEHFRVQQAGSALEKHDKEAEPEPLDVGGAVKAVQDRMESVNAMFALTYSVLADSEDMFKAMAATARLYVTTLMAVGFSQADAVSIASDYMSSINQVLHRKVGGQD